MKKSILSVIIVLAIVFSATAQDKKEIEAIKKVVQESYCEGLQNEGDAKKIDKGFHPDFNLLILGQKEEMSAYPIAEWKKNQVKKAKDGNLPLKGDKKVTIKFLNVDVTGTAAVAKIQFYIGEKLTYVDYISLYKFEKNWKMVNKIYYKFPDK